MASTIQSSSGTWCRSFSDYEIRHFVRFQTQNRLLPRSQHAGFTLIAASNGNSSFAQLPIASHFAHLHFAEDIGASKPDPKFFSSLLERAGGRPELAVSIGDRMENDYHPARSIGMQSVLVDRMGAVEDRNVLRIGSLLHLLHLLEPA
jgi:FMN phosphatase YigB (HAD superfamily)